MMFLALLYNRTSEYGLRAAEMLYLHACVRVCVGPGACVPHPNCVLQSRPSCCHHRFHVCLRRCKLLVFVCNPRASLTWVARCVVRSELLLASGEIGSGLQSDMYTNLHNLKLEQDPGTRATTSVFASVSVCVCVCSMSVLRLSSVSVQRLLVRVQCSHLVRIASSDPCPSRRRSRPISIHVCKAIIVPAHTAQDNGNSRILHLASHVRVRSRHTCASPEQRAGMHARTAQLLNPTSPPSPYLTLTLKLKLA